MVALIYANKGVNFLLQGVINPIKVKQICYVFIFHLNSWHLTEVLKAAPSLGKRGTEKRAGRSSFQTVSQFLPSLPFFHSILCGLMVLLYREPSREGGTCLGPLQEVRSSRGDIRNKIGAYLHLTCHSHFRLYFVRLAKDAPHLKRFIKSLLITGKRCFAQQNVVAREC